MIESPVLIELLDEHERNVMHRLILQVLEMRLGAVPEDLAAQVRAVQALDRLPELHYGAAICPDLETFRALLVP